MKYWYGWYQVPDDLVFTEDAWEWTQSTMGAPNESGRWFYQNGNYWFKNERDAMLYQLTWAGHTDSVLD